MNFDKEFDASGLACPLPIVKTKKALADMASGQVLRVISTDPGSVCDMAAFAEHFFPVLILVGLATRFSALVLIGMTLVIQLFVYPDAYPTHGTWIALLLLLLAKGPGSLSIDHLIARRYR